MMKNGMAKRWAALCTAFVVAAGSVCIPVPAADLLSDGDAGMWEGFAGNNEYDSVPGELASFDIVGAPAENNSELPGSQIEIPEGQDTAAGNSGFEEVPDSQAAEADGSGAEESFLDSGSFEAVEEVLDSGAADGDPADGASELLIEETEEETDSLLLEETDEAGEEASSEEGTDAADGDVLEEEAPEAEAASPAADFACTVSGNEVTITGYKGSAESVVVPAEIDGKPVTKIGSGAFNKDNSKTVKKITLSEGITTLSAGSFDGCEALEEFSFPASLVVTREDANMSEGKTVFPTGCLSLQRVRVAAGNTSMKEINGAVYSIDKTLLYFYPTGSESTSFTSVAGVKRICNAAFKDNKYITEVVLPDTVEEIGYGAFAYCEALSSMKSGYADDQHVHEMTFVQGYPATCESAGQKDCYKCEGCGLLFEDEAGNKALTDSDLVIPALGHRWDSGKVTKEATCTEAGIRTFTCQNNTGHTRTEEISALGHDYQEKIVKATFEKDGKISQVCSRCKDEKDIQVIPHPVTVKLSETEAEYDGNEHKPQVILLDGSGNDFPESMYRVDMPASMINAGAYTITVILQGNAEGTRNLTYTIKSSGTAPDLEFDDVTDSGKFYFTPVYWAVMMGITTGYKDTATGLPTGIFGVNDLCTREQIVTFLWRMQGSPAPRTRANFIDVKKGYYVDAISWALEHNITTGVSATTFGVGQDCSRAMCVTFLYRTAGNPSVSDGSAFTDVPEGKWFTKAVSWAAQNGITTGYKDSHGNPTGVFGLNDPCKRSEIVTFLYRFANLA